MKKTIFIVLTALFPLFSFSSTWETNKDHSVIMFQVPYMGLSEVNGRFNEFSGRVDLSENNQSIDWVEVKIMASSIDTGNKMRDGHLRGNDFFQVEEHPVIEFKSQKVSALSKGHYRARGELSIKGYKKILNIDFSISELTKDTWNFDNRFIKFKSSLNRKDFNIVWNKTLDHQEFLLGDVIDFSGVFQIQQVANKTPSSKHMIPDTKYIRSREIISRQGIKTEPVVDFSKVIVSIRSQTSLIPTQKTTNVSTRPEDFRESVLWWISLGVVGLFGFFSVIIISIYSKNILLEYFPRNYEENGLLGYLSDSIVMVYVILYSVALWFLGWGIR